jgi:hypothetical protein
MANETHYCHACGQPLPKQFRHPGCVCDLGEWGVEPEAIPAPCSEHVGNHDQNCENCEHDFECHGGPHGR